MPDRDALHFRLAREDDLDALIEIHHSAFPDARRHDARRTSLLAPGFGSFDDLRIAEKNGQIVAHAFLFPIKAWFGGAPVRVGAIASVGVAPEARGQNIGSALLDHLHALSRERGEALAMLYAFRQGFYHQHGYGTVSPSRRLVVTPRAVPRTWMMDADRLGLRRAAAEDRDEIVRVYEAASARSTGFLGRSERLWERRFIDERRQWFVVGPPRKVTGYVAWKLRQSEPHAMIRLVVDELVAEDDRTRRLLFGAIGAQRDQVTEFEIALADDDVIGRAFIDADVAGFGTSDVEHPLGVIVGGPLVRINDPALALEARGYSDEGSLAIDVTGATRVLLTVDRGRGKTRPLQDDHAADIAVDARTLSSILYGSLLPSDAARLGCLEARDDAALARADSLLALPSFFTLDAF